MSQLYQQKNTIQEYLYSKNIYPIKKYNSYGMYLSPFRKENLPSFKVDYVKDLYFDFGINKGGNLKTLKKILDTDFIECNKSFAKQTQNKTASLKNQIWSVQNLTNYDLKNYLSERKIAPEIYNEYCQELHFGFYPKYPLKGIGFTNDKGGFEIRSKKFKGCIGQKYISTFYNKEVNNVAVFEGFMDFLSFKTIYPKNFYNYIILNSTTQTRKAIDFLKLHTTIFCFLDNDIQGDLSTKLILEKTTSNVIDKRNLYSQFKDLNEFLITSKSDKHVSTEDIMKWRNAKL